MGEHHHDECDEAMHAVYVYLDGEMNPVEQQKVAVHLRRCRGCADAVEFEKQFLHRLKAACPETLPAGLVEKVQRVLRECADE